MKNRTGIDWSKHKLKVIKNDDVLIHTFYQPGTSTHCVKFINTNGIMAVTGDFGNWIFCREFHPSSQGAVSDGYWLEKLQIDSEQEGKEYDADGTADEINNMLNGGIEEYGWTGNDAEQVREYFEECLRLTDDELGYTAFAYREYPSFFDSESVIFVKKTKVWLECVFDAFDAICYTLKEQEDVAA